MEAYQSHQGAKFSKEDMATAQVNDKAIRKGTSNKEYVKACTIEMVKMLIKH